LGTQLFFTTSRRDTATRISLPETPALTISVFQTLLALFPGLQVRQICHRLRVDLGLAKGATESTVKRCLSTLLHYTRKKLQRVTALKLRPDIVARYRYWQNTILPGVDVNKCVWLDEMGCSFIHVVARRHGVSFFPAVAAMAALAERAECVSRAAATAGRQYLGDDASRTPLFS
jgi:hypothetical protein